jgi:hypothetical protein
VCGIDKERVRMYGSRTNRVKKLIIGTSAAALLAGAFAIATGLGEAAESCGPLDTALNNNLTFIAGQRANPDAQSAARIANRQAVVDLIQQRRAAAGCTAAAGAGGAAEGAGDAPAQPPAKAPANPPAAAAAAQNGDVVCEGSTVTLSGEGGAPAASSGTLPVGTKVTVSNLDNGKSITVDVTSVSGSCVLLNSAAFELVREPGKFLIRRAIIQRAGGGAAAPPAQAPAAPPAAPPAAGAPANPPAASGNVVCAGSTVTVSGEGGAPAASSGTFPLGTMLRVTNLDNNKVTTVQVASTSGSCVLLNTAAFEQVREPGKFLIRRAVIERVG